MPWFRRADGSMSAEDKDKKDDDIEFKPEKLKEDITKDIETKLTDFSTKQDEKMKPLLDMAASIAADREERRKAAETAAAKKAKDDNDLTAEDFMLDPAAATKRAIAEGTSGLTKATLMLAAKQNKQDTLMEKEYYHGDIKTKVDAMIAQQSLEYQCRADVVENCYKTVVFDHMKDIQEGKVKARTSSSNFDTGGTGGHKIEGKEGENETLTDDEKKAAAAFGLNDKDWIKSRREMSYV
jgi:hypothetical protein